MTAPITDKELVDFYNQVLDYINRSGDSMKDLELLLDRDITVIKLPKHRSWYSYYVQAGKLVIFTAYGNGKLILAHAKEEAKIKEASKIVFSTRRNPKAFERKFGFKQIGTVMELEIGK